MMTSIEIQPTNERDGAPKGAVIDDRYVAVTTDGRRFYLTHIKSSRMYCAGWSIEDAHGACYRSATGSSDPRTIKQGMKRLREIAETGGAGFLADGKLV